MTDIHALRVTDPNPFRAARAPNARTLYEALKTSPVSAVVAEPAAMPVTTAPLSELAPIFEDLARGSATPADGTVFRRGARFPDGRLDLCKQVVGPQWIGTLVDATRMGGHACGIEHFLLGNNVVGDDGAARIAGLIADGNGPRLKTLYLAGNAFGPAGTAALADALADDTEAEALWLKRRGQTGLTGLFIGINRLGDEGAAILANALTGYAPLTRFDIGANRVERSGLQAILSMASTVPSLHYLGVGLYKSASDMGELPNWFGEEGAADIADFIRSESGLLILDAKDCHLGHEGVAMLADALENQHTLLDLRCTQYGIRDASLYHRIDAFLARNVEAARGISLAQFRNHELRIVKHGPAIGHIDSIYRNKM
jgi:hypothetical protein